VVVGDFSGAGREMWMIDSKDLEFQEELVGVCVCGRARATSLTTNAQGHG